MVEHSKLQSKRSNPNARWQLGVLSQLTEEADPSPPNHGGDGVLTCPRQVTIAAGQDWGSALAVVPEGPCLRGLMPHKSLYTNLSLGATVTVYPIHSQSKLHNEYKGDTARSNGTHWGPTLQPNKS